MAQRRSTGSGHHGAAAKLAGGLVLLVAGGFYAYAAGVSGEGGPSGYPLNATFLSANGLAPGANVMLAGVTVGQVSQISLDPRSMMATVHFTVEDGLSLPADSRVSIGSATPTSQDALMIEPGHAPTRLAPGATIADTCDASSLEQQVSQYIFGNGGAPSGCGG